MKRLNVVPRRSRGKKMACSVPAAALMLGVSQAATIGFNFQCNYCNAHSYSGAVVTAPAFGVATNAWQSLPQMDTGYGCAVGYYTLDQVIDTTTPVGAGLNPLPRGSIHVTWSGYTANVSGFGGYTRSGPHYTFGGNGYNPGNEQVYWGFIRDGVNFGPGSSGGDNNQPGYSIELTGLKSVFTNSPFAVQLIASADSMQFLTNAFIIDATANTTQSVVYPSTPPVGDSGDTSWIRGIGGGLSTGSGAVDTDHLKIIGNRAAHAGNKTSGYNFASTIAGFIVTDKPVLSMQPQPAVASTGDTIVWSAYAVGVPPLSYQWRKNGAAIPGATQTSFGLTNVTAAMVAQYEVLVSNLFGAVTSAPVTIDRIMATPGNNFILDSNANGPEHDGLNNGATWMASSTDSAGITRTGVMKFAAASPGQIAVPGETNFNTAAGAIMFWVRSAGPTNTAAAKGSILFDRRTSDGMLIALNGDGTLTVQAGAGANAGTINSSAAVADNKWHHIALSSTDSGIISLYVDGVYDSFVGSLFVWPQGQELEFGLSHDPAWQPFDGLMNDIRVYNRALTDQEIAAIQNSGALVDANALVMRFEFAAPPMPGATLRWLTPDTVLQSADSLDGIYTDVPGGASPYPVAAHKKMKFYRHRGHTPTTVIANPYLM